MKTFCICQINGANFGDGLDWFRNDIATFLLLILNEIVLCLRALSLTTPMCSTGTDLGSNLGWIDKRTKL